MIRTVIGEAADEPKEGQAGVAHVIMNRMIDGSWGDTPSKIVLAPGQFEPWMTRRKSLLGIPRDSQIYQKTGDIVDGVVEGKIPDPTNGATYFLAPKIVMGRYGRLPDWASGKPLAKRGGHNFYHPNQPQNSDMSAIYDALGFYKEDQADGGR
jgi:N-acetylmuramoyl-L-alanine amidase